MLLQNSDTLENVIVGLLSINPLGLNAEQLRDEVGKNFRVYSRRGIYKELQRLITEGILVRSHSVYTLRLAWLLCLQNEIEKITRQIDDSAYLKLSLPSKEHPVMLHASNLVDWDRLWTQMMLVLHTSFPDLPMFIWCPHHWFTITHPEIENTFTKANESKKHIRFAIIGGRGYLDLRDREVLKRKSTCYSFRVSPFEYDRNHYYWVIGDFFGTCTLDSRTARRIDELYEKTSRSGDLGPNVRKYLTSQKCRGSVKCEWAPEKSEKIRSKFLSFFGVKLGERGELLTKKTGEY